MNRRSLIVILTLWLIAGFSASEIRAQSLMQNDGNQGTAQQQGRKFYFVMSSRDLVFQYGPNMGQRQQFDMLAKQVAESTMPRIESIMVTSYTSQTESSIGSVELAKARIGAVKDYLIRTLEHNELQDVKIVTQILSAEDDQSEQMVDEQANDPWLDGGDIYNKLRRVEFTVYLNAMSGYVPTTPEQQFNVTSESTFDSNLNSKAQEDRQLAAIVTNLYPVWTPGGGEKKQKYSQPSAAQTKQSDSPKSNYMGGAVNQILSIRTNIPYWLVIAPNLGVELYIGGRTSLLIESTFSYWNKKTDTGSNGIYVVEVGPEFRYWLSDDRSKPSHFFGVYGQYVDFDIKLNETGRQGSSMGGGISYGYYLPVGNRWAFEFGIGIGYLKNKFDVYKWNPVMESNVWVESKKTAWIGPTKIKAAVMFRIGNK